VIHINYGICEPDKTCAFNHEPANQPIAGSSFAYQATEKISCVLAHIAVQLLENPVMVANATAVTRAQQ
jgi:hypothetical protein